MVDQKARDHTYCGNYEAGGSMDNKIFKVVFQFTLFNLMVLSLFLSSFCTCSVL